MDPIYLDLDKIKEFFINVVLPLISLIIGVIPLVWGISFDRNRNHFFMLLIAASLTILTGILLFPFLPIQVYLGLSFLIFFFWIAIIYRKNIYTLLYRMGLFQIFKIRVAIVIPSNAFFNQELLNGFTSALSRSFKIYNKFDTNQRADVLHSQKTDVDYAYFIDDAIHKKIQYLVVHAKSRMLLEKNNFDALIRYSKSGGTIINLISQLDFEPFLIAQATLPYSIVLDDSSGVEVLAKTVLVEIKKDDSVLLLKGPDTSETSTRRLEILSKYLIGKKIKLDIESIDRWNADLAQKRIEHLVNEKKRSYDWVIAWNDEIALGVCHFFDNRLDISKKPKVVGFDKIPNSIAKINDPSSVFYRTVDMKMYAVGQRAAELLDLILSGANVMHSTYVHVSSGDIVSGQKL